ncbi:MAG: c-type cytochrome [Planctomycetes bacterium]|nr:c-type cytochrome [Planctomycetota bacterium]
MIVTAMLSFRGESSVRAKPPNPVARSLPSGPLGETIRLGETLVEQTATHPLTKPHVGNSLNCTSCHLKNGTSPKAATFIGVATAYPAWSPRERKVITLEDRVLNCFMRSCNGIRPPLGSKPSVAITAYISWLSDGEVLRMNAGNSKGPNAVPRLAVKPESASIERGELLYARKCATCHGKDGAGEDKNPPVWGQQSFNQGAGLADTVQLASWLKVAMPLDETDLADQEALDIAAFVNTHDRPSFNLKNHLPVESRLGEYNAEQTR